MKLSDFGSREEVVPWAAGGKIPWHEPAFSKRMLQAHLSQEHDRASRRFETIDKQVAWVHQHVLRATTARILDLGCGPGFYTTRFARLGHSCVGIDVSPASIEHARSEAEREALSCEYRLEDLGDADLGSGFDLVLFTFGELNCFPPANAETILAKARHALSPGGALVVEAQTEQLVRSLAQQEPTWFSASQGIFCDEPHLCLREGDWHPDSRAATERYFVVALGSGEVASYVNTTQAYADGEYVDALQRAGFTEVERHLSLAGDAVEAAADSAAADGLFVLVARVGATPGAAMEITVCEPSESDDACMYDSARPRSSTSRRKKTSFGSSTVRHI